VRASVPIRTERNLVLVPVSVAGSAPFTVILDTGMPTPGILLYASERVEALGLDFADAPSITGAGGTDTEFRTRVARGQIDVGGLTIEEVPVITLVAPPGFPKHHEGIIGSELFERFGVRIDVEKGRLELLDSAGIAPTEDSYVVPLHFRGGGPFLHARVTVAEGAPLPAELAIDLGASHALWLNSTSEPRFGSPPQSIATRLGQGLSGHVEGRVGRVRRLEIGDIALEDLVTVFPKADHQPPGGFDFRDGFVGAETLTRFRITFDYSGKRMLLEPGPRVRDPFEHDMTGLILEPSGPDRRVVVAVLSGSPAAEAGVLPGDALVAVDGKSIGALGPDGLMRAFRNEGADLRLTLERGVETLEKRVRLRRLV